MPKIRYKFNPQTLTYEVITMPLRLKFYRVLRKIFIGFILASVVNLLFSYFVYTPKMYRITENNSELILKYNILNDKIKAATDKINEIKHRDYTVYRPLFAADTLNIKGIYSPYPDSKYAPFFGDIYTSIMYDTWQNLDDVTKLIYLESKSLDELEVLSKNKALMAEAIPAIWPVDRRGLRGSIGAFGTRIHPISGRSAFHDGIDLGGNTGAPVYATGDGVVAFDNIGKAGYGKQIFLTHGFGYNTRYAHLSKILVTPGQKVKRGEKIGEVGSTGRSTGPHLHYEVLYMGKTVDPLNYFSRDMSEEEFARIVESAQSTTFEF